MRFDNEGMRLWYGESGTPAPGEFVQAGTEITVTVRVEPAHASNRVEVLYRRNRGRTEKVAARWVRNHPSGTSQYYMARLPAFEAGDAVEYMPICRCAGRQVPSPDKAQELASSFRVVRAKAEPAREATPPSKEPGLDEAETERARGVAPPTPGPARPDADKPEVLNRLPSGNIRPPGTEYKRLTADLERKHTELIKALRRRRITSVFEFQKEDWLKLFKEEGMAAPDRFAGEEDPLAAYANFLLDVVAKRFPSHLFVNRLKAERFESYREDVGGLTNFLAVHPDARLQNGQLVHEDGRSVDPTGSGLDFDVDRASRLCALYGEMGVEGLLNDTSLDPETKLEALSAKTTQLASFFDQNPDIDLINSDLRTGILVPAFGSVRPRDSVALLTLDAERHGELQEGPVPDALRVDFQHEAGVTLSPESAVIATDTGWRITDADSNRAYRVHPEDGGLRVYQDIDWSGIGEDKEAVTNQLKTYQRLLRIDPRYETVERLLLNGYTSAIQIANQPVQTILDMFQDDQEHGRRVYGNALVTTERSTLMWHNAREIGSQTLRDTLFDNATDDLIQYIKDQPGFQELFELPRFCDCKDCRSVFGPAAYFVDLMGFIDEHITGHERLLRQQGLGDIPPGVTLSERRPDLWTIPLDCEHANRLVSFLDIVNAVLEKRIEGALGVNDPYGELTTARHPCNLPFNLPLAQIRLYLRHFKTTLHDVLESFGISGGDLAMEYLGLSAVAYQVITTSQTTAPQLKRVYGITQPGLLVPPDLWGLRRVDTFLRHTGLTRRELADLIYQNLDQDERNREVQASFFINRVRDGNNHQPMGPLAIEMDNSDPNDAHEALRNLSAAKLDRIHRFVRLARAVGWSLEELDWTLRSIGKNALDQNLDQDALLKIYRIKRWQDRLKIPLDVLCSFWFNVKQIGRRTADGPPSQALADRVFNNPQVLAGAAPYDFGAPLILVRSWDKHDLADAERGWLLASLEVTDQELDRLGATIPANQVRLNLDNLSTLYRLSKLPKILGIAIAEFFELLDLLIPNDYGQITNFDVLDGVIETVGWLKEARWSIYDLHYMVTGKINERIDPGYQETDVRLWLEALVSASVTITAAALTEIEGLTEELATRLLAELVQNGFVTVGAASDTGKLTAQFDPSAAGFTLQPLSQPFNSTTEERKIIEYLTRKRDEQQQVVLEKLGIFFGLEPALVRSMLGFAGLSLGSAQTLNSFYAGIPDTIATDETVPVSQTVSEFLAALHYARFLVDKLDLTQAEIEDLTAHPEHFNINDLRNLTPEDVKHLYDYKHLARSLPDPEGLLAFFDLNTQVVHDDFFVGLQLESDAQVTQAQSADLIEELVNNGLLQKADPNDNHGWLTPAFTPYSQGFILQPLSAPFDDAIEEAKVLARLKEAKTAHLGALLRTDADQIETLAQRHGQLGVLDDLLAIKRQVDVSNHLGTNVELLLRLMDFRNQTWDGQKDLAQALLEVFKAKHGEENWAEQFEPFEDLLREHKREALAAYIIGRERRLGLETLDDLYQFLLIDVQMSSEANDISPIKQAILSAQLYVERCLMNLEIGVPPERIPQQWEQQWEQQWAGMKKQWAWMKNYRIWEANRRVFLYPENYIQPELRDDRSPIFKELEDELLQADITDPAVEKAYRNYLDKFAELANLHIAGSYYHTDNPVTDTGTLYLVGRTATTPYTYYYRKYISTLTPEDDEREPRRIVTWTPWEKIDLSIKSDYVSPIFAFNRLFVFWVELSTIKHSTIQTGIVTDPEEFHHASINYSFLNFNKNWVQPQRLAKEDLGRLEAIPRVLQRVFPGFDVTWDGYAFGRSEEISITYNFRRVGQLNANLRVLPPAANHIRGAYDFRTLAVNESNLVEEKMLVAFVEPDEFAEYLTGAYYGTSSEYSGEADLLKSITQHDRPSLAVVDNRLDWNFFDNGDEEFLVRREDNTLALDEYARMLAGYEERAMEEGWGVPDYQSPPLYLHVFERLSTHIVHDLSLRLLAGGIDNLLTIESQQEPKELSFNRMAPTQIVVPPDSEQLDFEGSYGYYYQEIFFHMPFLIANQLNSNQRFEEAQRWYHYIFDPTATVPASAQLAHKNDRYWQYLPFRDKTVPSFEAMLTNPAALRAYREHPFQPHAIARLRVGVYQKSVVLKYIDNLIDWAEYLFTLDSWESITEATLLYVLAYNILGGQPLPELEPCEIPPTQTYQDIYDKYGSGKEIPDFWIEVENTSFGNLLFSSTRPTFIGALSSSGSLNVGDLEIQGRVPPSLLYFCVPENETLRDYQQRVQDGLYKIRHGLNIEGVRRELPLYEPRIDPMVLVRAAAGGRDISTVLSEVMRPLPHYRFAYMIDRARNLTAQVQQFGSALLAALEKQDAEELVLRRATDEQAIQQLVKKVREQQRDEAEKNLEALRESKASIDTRRKHYQELISRGLSSRENLHIASMLMAWQFDQMSQMMNLDASVAHLVPNTGAPTAMTYGGREVGSSLRGVAEAFRMFSSYLNLIGTMSVTLGGYDRRKQEWELQQKLAQQDLDQVEQQLAAAELRWQIAQQELAAHEKQIEQSEEIYEFLRDKFTNRDLYRWMAGQLSGLYFQAYKMAYDVAKSAEKAFQYERDTDDTYIQFGHWDSLKKGLLAGERLLLELSHLEKAYLENNRRSFEIEKTVSLGQLDPLQLVALKESGSCEFKLTEELFAYDYPGHYLRKIKSIAVSIPAIVGPYQQIHATLTLLGSKTLLRPDVDAVRHLLGDQNVAEPDTGTLRADWRAQQQIALSQGVNDVGLFEMNFRDERYLPFEGSGVVSTWRLDMPRENNLIDFDSIADVIITIRYTAEQGGDHFAGEVNTALGDLAPRGVYLMRSLQHEFPSEWHGFLHPRDTSPNHELSLSFTEDVFPPNFDVWAPPGAEDVLPSLRSVSVKAQWENVDLDALDPPEGPGALGRQPAEGQRATLDIQLSVANAGVLDFNIDNAGIAHQNGVIANPFGTWTLRVDRSTIPAPLRLKDENNNDENENDENKNYVEVMINNTPHYTLDAARLHNIGLIAYFQHDPLGPA